MTASLGGFAPRSIFWPQVGEIVPGLVEPATTARSSLGVAAMQLAANFAQSALSLTPIDPRITTWLSPAAWPVLWAGRSEFRRILSLVTEFGTMKKLSLSLAVLAAGLMMVLNGSVSAHPGIEGVLECHDDEGAEDAERAVLFEDDEEGEEEGRTFECDDCEDDDETSRAAVADDCEDDDDHERAAVAEDKEEDDSES